MAGRFQQTYHVTTGPHVLFRCRSRPKFNDPCEPAEMQTYDGADLQSDGETIVERYYARRETAIAAFRESWGDLTVDLLAIARVQRVTFPAVSVLSGPPGPGSDPPSEAQLAAEARRQKIEMVLLDDTAGDEIFGLVLTRRIHDHIEVASSRIPQRTALAIRLRHFARRFL
jgi:hypothetical protein